MQFYLAESVSLCLSVNNSECVLHRLSLTINLKNFIHPENPDVVKEDENHQQWTPEGQNGWRRETEDGH